MTRNVTLSGRPRSDNEQLFTAALTAELNREQERHSMDQRSFSTYLGIHESLLSYYRSGQRHPSQTAMCAIDEKLPGFAGRVWDRYYRLKREMAAASEEPPEPDEPSYTMAHDPFERVCVGV